MNAKTQAAVTKHGHNLIALFHLDPDTDPVKLCKALRRWERKGQALGLRLCNGPEFPPQADGEELEEPDHICDLILKGVDALLNFRAQRIPVIVNRDPRGYALKIASDWMYTRRSATDNAPLYTDLGGYGIIAPDLTMED